MTKMIKNSYYKNLTYDKLEESYLLCRRGKREKSEVIRFEMNREYNLTKILNDLKNNSYVFDKYKEFKIYEPKERTVLAACFRDRVVHTWYVKSFIDTIFIPQFINTSYACLKNKGMHSCVLDVKKALLKHDPSDYVLKMDVAKFFNNIDKDILYKIIERKISDKNILKLTRDILNSSERVPIGNYTSQMFANIYLNEIDQYAKHVLKCKEYFRYMDDTVIIGKDKDELKYYLEKMQEFLEEKLKLKLNSKTNIFKVKQGVNFCGYKIYAGYMKIRTRCKNNLYKKVKYIYKNNIVDYKLLLNGHLGYINYANCYRLKKSIENKYGIII